MITRRVFMALVAGTSAAMAGSPTLARLGRSAPMLGEVWGLGFLAAGGTLVHHAPPNPALFPDGAWHPDFV